MKLRKMKTNLQNFALHSGHMNTFSTSFDMIISAVNWHFLQLKYKHKKVN